MMNSPYCPLIPFRARARAQTNERRAIDERFMTDASIGSDNDGLLTRGQFVLRIESIGGGIGGIIVALSFLVLT